MHRIKIALTAVLLVGGCFSPAFSQSFGQFKQLADDAFNAGKFGEAEKIWTQAKTSCEQNDDKGPRYQACMAGLAKALAAQNKTAEAEPLYKNLLAAKDAGSASEEVDAAIADYISMLKKAGKDDAAKEIAAKYPVKTASTPPAVASQTSSATGPQEQWRHATETGTQALTAKQYDKAEQSFKQALSVAENAQLIKESADSLNRLVRLYSWQKKYSQAETMCAHLVDLVKLSSGARSQAYADMLLAHADLLRHLNRTSEAMKREALADTINGPNSPSAATGFSPGGSDSGGGSANKDGYVTHGGEGTRNGGSIWNRARAAQQTGGGGSGSYNNLVNDLLKE